MMGLVLLVEVEDGVEEMQAISFVCLASGMLGTDGRTEPKIPPRGISPPEIRDQPNRTTLRLLSNTTSS